MNELKLCRRVIAAGAARDNDVILFHHDHSLVVVNVALNDNFEGAALVYARRSCGDSVDRLWVPDRASGDATAHDCIVVHGVTHLAAGIRTTRMPSLNPASPRMTNKTAASTRWARRGRSKLYNMLRQGGAVGL